jgi:hypothetical protein
MLIETNEEVTEEITDPALAFTIANMHKKSSHALLSGSVSIKDLQKQPSGELTKTSAAGKAVSNTAEKEVVIKISNVKRPQRLSKKLWDQITTVRSPASSLELSSQSARDSIVSKEGVTPDSFTDRMPAPI